MTRQAPSAVVFAPPRRLLQSNRRGGASLRISVCALQRYPASSRATQVFPVLLLLMPIAPEKTADKRTVAIMIVRHDNLRSRTRGELLPIAQTTVGGFRGITPEQPNDDAPCAAVGSASSFRRGEQYDVYFRGRRVGQATTGTYGVSPYDCSGLCVLATPVRFPVPEQALLDTRVGIDEYGMFDETLRHLVALPPSAREWVSDTSAPTVLPVGTRDLVTQWVSRELPSRGLGGNVTVEDVKFFRSTTRHGLEAFVTAVREEDGELAVVSAVVRVGVGRDAEVLFRFLRKGDPDRGAASYEFLDAVDVDGAMVLRTSLLSTMTTSSTSSSSFSLRSGKYEVVHRGPSFGC